MYIFVVPVQSDFVFSYFAVIKQTNLIVLIKCIRLLFSESKIVFSLLLNLAVYQANSLIGNFILLIFPHSFISTAKNNKPVSLFINY